MPSADFVLHNAQIYTVDDACPTASALAVEAGRFIDVGRARAMLDKYPHARPIDAEGCSVVPGLIDAHAHLQELGHSLRQADLTDISSPADAGDRLKTFVAEHDLPDGAWIRGHGWDETEWPSGGLPTRDPLDEAFPTRPVWLTRTDVHAGWANTAALEATVGLPQLRAEADPDGGRICRDSDGEPTGVLIDEAMGLVADKIPSPPDAERDAALETALNHAAAHGLTGLHDAGVNLSTTRRYRRFIEEDIFPLRVYAMIGGQGETFDHFSEDGPLHHPSGRLRVESVKFFADGALGSRGAALLDEYTDDPGNRGFLCYSNDEFRRRVQAAVECGFQVNTHAIGDRANRFVLDAYEAAAEQCEVSIRRPRIEHAQVVHPDDRHRFGDLGVIASVQPGFATSDMDWAPARLGSRRIDRAYAWTSLQDAGARLAFGSDAPVEPLDPLRGFHAAITRQDDENQPDGGWQPAERVSRWRALHAYTLGGAHAAFMENEVGSITPGKRADFTVLSKNIMNGPPSRVLEADVIATYVGGATTHVRPAWPDRPSPRPDSP